MNKYLIIGFLIVMLIFTTVGGLASGVERLPAKVVPGTEIKVPQAAINNGQDLEKNRIIVPTTSLVDKNIFRLKGCKILHELNDATALKCPDGVVIENARTDRLFKLNDLNADIQINADDAWSSGIDGRGVKVAILDTGVDINHIELQGNIIATNNFVAGESGNDMDGHGTHVSGIIAGKGILTLSGSNARGVAPGASIIVGKVCGINGCYESDISAGIEWAVAQGARVLSMSFGGWNYGSHCDGDTLAGKANWAASQGVVTLASAGNDGRGVSSPACGSQVIAVGVVNENDIRPSWSNFGTALDLMAPGVNIFSTYSCDAKSDCTYYWYAWMSGTSMSAPHVSGLAALILQKHPEYSADDVKEAMYKSAKDLGATGWDQFYGWGRVDAQGAVNYEIVHDIAVTSISAPSPVPQGTSVDINVNVANLGTKTENFIVTVTTGTNTIGSKGVSLNAGTSTNVGFNWDTSSYGIDDHVILAKASKVPGETATANNEQTKVVTISSPDSTPPTVPEMHVDSIALSKSKNFATATVKIFDGSNQPVPGALVNGKWTGPVSSTVSGTTDSNGRVVLRSPSTRRHGLLTFTVEDVVKTGWIYNQSADVVSSGSIEI